MLKGQCHLFLVSFLNNQEPYLYGVNVEEMAQFC